MITNVKKRMWGSYIKEIYSRQVTKIVKKWTLKSSVMRVNKTSSQAWRTKMSSRRCISPPAPRLGRNRRTNKLDWIRTHQECSKSQKVILHSQQWLRLKSSLLNLSDLQIGIILLQILQIKILERLMTFSRIESSPI